MPLRLTGTEQALLNALPTSPRQPVSRIELIEDLGRNPGDETSENSERAIDVQITRLRREDRTRPERAALPANRARHRIHAVLD